jgi:hypothetical protein
MNCLKTSKLPSLFCSVAGEGQPILNEIVQSNKPSCQLIKNLVSEEIAAGKLTADKCHWLSIPKGLQRNLIFGIGYFRFIRDQIVNLRGISKSDPNYLKILNAHTLIAYNEGPTNYAAELSGKINNSTEHLKLLYKRYDYLQQTESKYTEDILKPLGITSCIKH